MARSLCGPAVWDQAGPSPSPWPAGVASPPECQPAAPRPRGQPHLLLIGDPGTGKSQLPALCQPASPADSVLTTGVGSSASGPGPPAAVAKAGQSPALTASRARRLRASPNGGQICPDCGSRCFNSDLASAALTSSNLRWRAGTRTCITQANGSSPDPVRGARPRLVCYSSTPACFACWPPPNPHGKLDTRPEPFSVNTNLASPRWPQRFDLVLDSNDLPVNDKENAPTLAPAASEPPSSSRRGTQCGTWSACRPTLRTLAASTRPSEPRPGAVLTAYYQRQAGAPRRRINLAPIVAPRDNHTPIGELHPAGRSSRQADAQADCQPAGTRSWPSRLLKPPWSAPLWFQEMAEAAAFPEQPDAEFAQEARQLLAALGLHRLLASAVDGEVGTMIGDAIDAASVINLSPPGGRPVLALSRQEFRAGEKSRLASSASSASPAKRRRTIVDDVDNNDEDNDKQKWENAKSSLAVDNVANTLVQSISSASSAALQFDIQTDWFQAGQNSDGVSNPPATSVPHFRSGHFRSGYFRPSTSGLVLPASNAFCPIFSIDDFDIPDVIDNLETPKEAVSGKTAAVVAMDTNQTQPENSGRLSGAPMLPPPPPAAAITNSQQPSQRFAFKRLSACANDVFVNGFCRRRRQRSFKPSACSGHNGQLKAGVVKEVPPLLKRPPFGLPRAGPPSTDRSFGVGRPSRRRSVDPLEAEPKRGQVKKPKTHRGSELSQQHLVGRRSYLAGNEAAARWATAAPLRCPLTPVATGSGRCPPRPPPPPPLQPARMSVASSFSRVDSASAALRLPPRVRRSRVVPAAPLPRRAVLTVPLLSVPELGGGRRCPDAPSDLWRLRAAGARCAAATAAGGAQRSGLMPATVGHLLPPRKSPFRRTGLWLQASFGSNRPGESQTDKNPVESRAFEASVQFNAHCQKLIVCHL
uniref:MCM domain-containing protein n=1 Tax=Macrostomum lignano TaxID=282301 RepID=A0A1I8F5Z6_9PLAT